MENFGWIRLYRKSFDNFLYNENRPLTRREAWEDILLRVNFIDGEVLIGNKNITCKSGQSIKSLDSWGKIFNWDKSKVRRFFKLLSENSMIEIENLKKTTRITVCNYAHYQSNRNTSETQTKRKRNASETQTTPIEERNKEENVKNENNYKTTLLSDLKKSDFDNPKYLDVTIAFFELFKKNLIEAGASTSTLEKSKGVWVDHIRLMYETDKQTSESVKKVFEFLQVDEFWKKNILSTATLRKQFNKLLMNAKNKTNGTTTKQPATSDSELIEVLSKHFD